MTDGILVERNLLEKLPAILKTLFKRISAGTRHLIRLSFPAIAVFFLMYSDRFLPSAPLTAAFFAAALAAGESPLALCAGCALGTIRFPLSNAALIPAAGCVLTLACEFAFSLIRRLQTVDPDTRVSISAGLSVLIPAMAAANARPLESVEALACASLSAAAAPFLRAMLTDTELQSRAAQTGFLALSAGMLAGIGALSPLAGIGAASAALYTAVRRSASGACARRQTVKLRRRMLALGEAFGNMAESCAQTTDMPCEQALIRDLRERLCSGCPNYTGCWTGSENRATRLLCRLIGDAIAAADDSSGNRLLYGDGEIPPDILRACRRGRMIPERLGLILRDFSDRRRSEIKRCATGRLLSVQLRQAQSILCDLAAHSPYRSIKNARYAADAGVCCASGTLGDISGDSHRICTLDDGHLALMLSDGMGMGETAAEESREALRLLACFLRAGISRSLVLETLNQQMLMRTGEDIFATVDLCVIDLNTGEAEFSKLAASQTLILRGREVIRIEGGCLPLGILEHVEPARARIRLRSGDIVVMGSDGVMESGAPIERAAQLASEAEPGIIAERLVREAAIARGNAHPDDRTCICARIQMKNAAARGA